MALGMQAGGRLALHWTLATGSHMQSPSTRGLPCLTQSRESTSLAGMCVTYVQACLALAPGALAQRLSPVSTPRRDVTRHLQLQLRKQGYTFHTSAEFEIVREIKEKVCECSKCAHSTLGLCSFLAHACVLYMSHILVMPTFPSLVLSGIVARWLHVAQL